MGQGGGVQLLNGTNVHWVLTQISQDDMNSWPFPQVILAGNSVINYVEWAASGSPSATATYTLNGTNLSFQLRATSDGAFDISVALDGIQSAKYPSGVVDLGWNHNGDVYFLLAGDAGNFHVSTLPMNWMQDNLPILGGRTMRELCITGSHDSGMGVTSIVTSCWAQTQSQSVLGQLQTGARYFDIRPVVSGGIYRTGHYTGNDPGAHGANGETIASIVQGINEFTATNAELIILNLSHDNETDDNYIDFSQEHWNDLMTALSEIQSLYIAGRGVTDLSLLTLNDFIGGGTAAVVVTVQPNDPNIQLGAFGSRGFYPYSSFGPTNNYTDTTDVATMMTSQYFQMRAQRTSRDAPLFLLSWTLTQSSLSDPCISELAAIANPQLHLTLLSNCTYDCFPNILYVDYFFPNMVALAMFVNCLASYPADIRTSPPFTVAASATTMAMIYRDGQSGLKMLTAGTDLAWSAPAQLPNTINSVMAPAATYWNGILAILYRGVAGDLKLWSATQPNDWVDLAPQGDTTTVTPALAATDNLLQGVFLSAANDGTIFVSSRSNQASWHSVQLAPALTTFFTPAAAVMNQQLYILFRSSADATLYCYQPTPNTLAHVQPDEVTTLWSPALTALNGKLYAVYRSATDLTMWTTNSADGQNWSSPTQLPASATTLLAPAITVFNGTLYVLYASAADNSVGQVSSTDGVDWSGPTTVLADMS